jgi:prepilin signal peptidase PulO-like enzyme (type II secretory pathway)
MIDIFLYILVIIFGLGFGSFATMAVYRIPNNIPWISEKPFCPRCKHELYFRDYFSILSFFINKGYCRFCKNKIEFSYAYLITEILILGYLLINFNIFGFSDTFILNSGIIIAISIWSIILTKAKKNIDEILKITLVFICLNKVQSGITITDLIFQIFFSTLFVLVNWHIVQIFRGRFKESTAYLQFSSDNRFLSDKFIILKISILTILSLPVSLPNYIGLYIVALLSLLIKNNNLRLSILSQLIIISNFL